MCCQFTKLGHWDLTCEPIALDSRRVLGLAVATLLVPAISGQQDHQAHDFPVVPLPRKNGPLRKALLLLREGKTAEARTELEAQRKLRPNDAEVLYQIARSYLMDFYTLDDPDKRRVSLALAMEMLDGTLQHDPDHIPALRAKAVILPAPSCCTTIPTWPTNWPPASPDWSPTTTDSCST